MLPTVLNYMAIGLFMQAMIVFVEVCINLKRPFVLKLIILLITVGFAWRGIGFVYCYHYSYNRWAMEMPPSLLAAGSVCLFAYIYESKLKWYIISFGLLVLIVNLGFHTYFTFIVPVGAGTALWTLPGATGTFLKALKAFFALAMLLISLRILLRILIKYKSRNIYFIQLRRWTLWLLLFQLFSGLSFVTYNYTEDAQRNSIPFLFVLVFNFMAVLLLLFRPKFLNRSNLKIKLGNLFDKKSDDGLSEKLFGEVFYTNVFYLNKDASGETLRKQLNVSAETLNNFLYNNYGLGLTDMVNKNRINYFMDLVSSGKYGNYTIDALAQEAGFGSRFHLYKSFKKFHGGTPSDFIRSVTD